MGFFDYFKNKQPQPIQKKALTSPLCYPLIGSGVPQWYSDNSQTFIDQYTANPVIYSIVKLITDKISSVPFYLYEVKNGKGLKQLKALNLNKDFTSYKYVTTKSQTLTEVESHKILDILENPNEQQSWSEFVKAVVGYKLITGNSYIYGLSPEMGVNKGKIQGMTVLPSQMINIIGNTNTDYYNIIGSNTRIEKESICHLKYFNPQYQNGIHLYGHSPLKSALKTVQLSNSSIETAISSIESKGAYGMLYDKSMTLEPEQLKTLKEKFQNASPNELMIVSGELDFINFGIPPEDLQILQMMDISLRDLCNVYGVSSVLFGDSNNKTFSNYEQAEKSLVYNVLVPELVALRDSLNKWLVSSYNKSENKQYYIDFDISVMPELAKDMDKVINQLKEMWWVTGNEKRVASNYGEDQSNPLMNEYMIPQNLVPISDQKIDLDEVKKDLNDDNLNDY